MCVGKRRRPACGSRGSHDAASSCPARCARVHSWRGSPGILQRYAKAGDASAAEEVFEILSEIEDDAIEAVTLGYSPSSSLARDGYSPVLYSHTWAKNSRYLPHIQHHCALAWSVTFAGRRTGDGDGHGMKLMEIPHPEHDKVFKLSLIHI